jgi:ribonuclease HI
MAFLLACDIMEATGDKKVEIVSDNLVVLGWITSPCRDWDPLLASLHSLWQKKRIVLAKVKGHFGNAGNELADKWAGRARRETDPRNVRGLNGRPKN